MYKPSVFNTVFPIEKPNEFIVYNTLYRTVAVVPQQALNILGWSTETVEHVFTRDNPGVLKSLIGEGPGELLELSSSLLIDAPSFIETAKELNFLIPEERNEYEVLDAYLDKGYNPNAFYPVIAFTAACNLDCVYCFEEGSVDRRDKMSPALAHKTIEWMESYIDEHPNLQAIGLGLFGGEPLLYLKAADYFIDETSKLAKRKGLEFEFGITTNGTKIERELIKGWVKKGLSQVRVTLDGPADIHDDRRYYRNKKKTGSFWDILERITSISDIWGYDLAIEVNIDKENHNRIGDLLDVLEQANLKERITVIPEQTLDTLANSVYGSSCASGGCGTSCGSGYNTPSNDNNSNWLNNNVMRGYELANAFVNVVDEIAGRGFTLPEMVGVYYPCIFVQKHHVVIDWHGKIYKCSFTIGNEDMTAGDIETGFNSKNQDMLDSIRSIDWCKERKCAYIPICGGGCRYEAYNKTGSYYTPNCKAELIDAVLPRSVPYYFNERPRKQNNNRSNFSEIAVPIDKIIRKKDTEETQERHINA